jgi:subtilase family serine protease
MFRAFQTIFVAFITILFASGASAGNPDATVRLPGHVLPALAKAIPHNGSAAVRNGLSERNQPLSLTLTLRRDDQAGFDAYLREIYSPHSKVFHRFLTQRQIADRFGPSRDDYTAVLKWLRTNGFRLVQGSKNRLTITVRGTRGDAERAFQIKIGDYRLDGVNFYANNANPALPARIAAHVEAIVGLSDLARPTRVGSTKEAIDAAKEANEGQIPYSCYLASAMDAGERGSLALDLAGGEIGLSAISPAVTLLRFQCAADTLNMVAAYAANPGPAPELRQLAATQSGTLAPQTLSTTGPGAGQKIGLLEFDNYHTSDVQNYLNLLGFPTRIGNLSRVDVSGGAGAPGAGEAEVLLDIDAVMGLAPAAQVVVYDAPFTGRGSFQAVFNAMIGDGDNIISNSWAYCEDQTTLADVQSLDTIFANAAAAGITVLNGSGDHGSTCLDGSPNTVHVPADSPHATAVGGTSPTFNLLGTYGGETWWDGTNNTPPTGQGGYGLSRFFARPSYQGGLNTAAARSVPDVTAPADPEEGFSICQADDGGCPTGMLYGGTSVATPIWAAAVALLNQSTGKELGFLNPSLYPLANTNAFHSATSMGSTFAQVGLGSPNIAAMSLALSGGSAGSVDTATSVVAPFPPIAAADGVSDVGVAVVLLDSNYRTISGQTVQLKANTGSSAVVTAVNAISNASNGAALFTVTDTTPETVTLTASTGAGTLANTGTVTFEYPPAAAGGINANPTTVTANGTSTTTITVTLQDAKGNPSPDKIVGLSQGNGSSVVSGATGTTNSNGTIAFTATDTVAENVTYTATDITDGNLPVPGSAVVDYTNSTVSNPCNIGIGTAAAGYAVSTFASGFLPYASSCIGPIGLAFDAQGNLFVAANNNGSIYSSPPLYKFGPQGGVADPGHLLSTPPLAQILAGLAFTSDGHLYLASSNNDYGGVYQIDPSNGALLGQVVGLDSAEGLAADPISGDLFVSAGVFGGNSIYTISNFASGPGTLTLYNKPPASAPDGIAVAPDGTLYAASGGNIYSITGTNAPTPGVATLVASIPTADGIAIGYNAANPSAPPLYVNANNGTITKVDTSTSPPTLTVIYSGGSRGDFVTVGPDGCMYAIQTDRIIKLTNAE